MIHMGEDLGMAKAQALVHKTFLSSSNDNLFERKVCREVIKCISCLAFAPNTGDPTVSSHNIQHLQELQLRQKAVRFLCAGKRPRNMPIFEEMRGDPQSSVFGLPVSQTALNPTVPSGRETGINAGCGLSTDGNAFILSHTMLKPIRTHGILVFKQRIGSFNPSMSS